MLRDLQKRHMRGINSGEKAAKNTPTTGEEASLGRRSSLEHFPESHSGGVATGDNSRIKEQVREVPGIGECQLHVDGLELVHQMNQDLDARSQIQDASDLALALECSTHAFVLLGALQTALIFQGKARSFFADPHFYDGVVVLLIGRPRNGVKGCDFYLRLPAGEQVLVRKCQLNCIQLERMKNLRKVRKMLGIGMKNRRELAMMFKHGKSCSRDPIDERSGAKHAFADRKMAGVDEPPGAPVEAASAMVKPAELHEVEQLLMAHET